MSDCESFGSGVDVEAPATQEVEYRVEDDSSAGLPEEVASPSHIPSEGGELDYRQTNGLAVSPSPERFQHDNISHPSPTRHVSSGWTDREYPEQSLTTKVMDSLYPTISTASLMSKDSYIKNRPETLVNPSLSPESKKVILKGYDLGFTAPKLKIMFEVIYICIGRSSRK